MRPFLETTNNFTPMLSAAVLTAGAGQIVAPGPDPTAPTRGIMVGTAGTITVTMADGVSSVTLTVPATACGTMLYLAITKMTAATAGGVVGFW